MPRDLRRRLEEYLQCNLRQSGSSPSSKFDARQDTDRGRLYGCRLPVGGGRSTCIKVQSCLVVIVVTSAPPIPFGSKNGAFTCGFAYVQPHVFDYAADVRAPNITGTVKSGGIISTEEVTGVFTGSSNGRYGNGATHNDVVVDQCQRTIFGADKSNSLFGKATTIQPQSIRFLTCIKF